MTRLSAYGISVEVPAGWEGRAFRHGDGGEPTLHLASFPLPRSDGEFGTRATGRMPADGVFLSLTEYRVDAGELATGIFAGSRPVRLRTGELSERTLLLPIAGQRGLQRFFSTAGRAFCLYAVVGRDGGHRLAAADRALGSLEIEPPQRSSPFGEGRS